MNIYRLIYCYRRRRKQNFFLFIFLILIISSYFYYWSIEIYFSNNENQLFENHQSKNDELAKLDPIFNKYIRHPFNINIWNIIQDSNRKYQQNHLNRKYLVYSCRFMCGGNTFLFN